MCVSSATVALLLAALPQMDSAVACATESEAEVTPGCVEREGIDRGEMWEIWGVVVLPSTENEGARAPSLISDDDLSPSAGFTVLPEHTAGTALPFAVA